MNPRQISALVVGLQKNDAQSGVSGLESLARKIEDSITINANGVLDAEVIARFAGSKDSNNRYIISTSEPAIVQNAKAMINLLRSLDNIPPQIIETVLKGSASLTEAFLQSKTDFSLTSIAQMVGEKGLDATGVAADIFTNPAKYAADAATSTASYLWQNRGAILRPIETAKNVKNAVSSAVTSAVTSVKDTVSGKFGLNEIQAAIADFTVYMNLMRQLAGTVQEMANSTDPAVKQIRALSNILIENDIYKLYEQFNHGMSHLTKGNAAEAVQNVGGFQAKVSGLIVEPLQSKITELTASQRVIMAAINEIKSLADKKLDELGVKNFRNANTGLYEINAGTKLTNEQIQLMKIANIAQELSVLCDRIMRTQNDGVKFKDRKDLLDCINKLGSIWNELQQIDSSVISSSLLEKGIHQVYDALLTPVKEVITFALQTEIKLGLSKDILLPNLQTVTTGMNAFAEANGLRKTSGYPFAEERKIALARNMVEIEGRQKKITDAAEFIRNNPVKGPAYLMQILKTIEKLKQIPTISAEVYMQQLINLRDEITGLKEMQNKIGKLESEIFILHEKIKNTDVSKLDQQELIFLENDKQKLAAKIQEVKALYVPRDLLLDALEKADKFKDNFGQRNNNADMYFQADDYIHIREKATQKQIATITALQGKVLNDVDSMQEDAWRELERLDAQVVALGGNSKEYMEREEARLASSEKAEGVTSEQPTEKRASELSQKELADIQKRVQKRNEENLQLRKADIEGRSETEVMAGIRQQSGGKLIEAFNGKKMEFMAAIKNNLNEKQKALLNEDKKDKNGLFLPDPGDTALVRCIKDINNVMTKFENLMELYVKFNAISAGGYANTELLGLLAPLRDNINALAADLKQAANDLRVLGAVVGNTVGTTVMNELYNVLPVIDQIPQIISQVSGNMQSLSNTLDIQKFTSMGDVPKQNLAKAVDMTRTMGEGFPSPEEIMTKTRQQAPGINMKALIGDAVVKMHQNINKATYGILEQAGIKTDKNGLYNLNKIKGDTLEYGIAMLHNELTKLRDSLDACAAVAEGRNAIGTAQLVGVAISAFMDYMQQYDKFIKQTLVKYTGVATDVRNQLKSDYAKLTPELVKAAEGLLVVAKNFLTEAQVMEITMGLKTGVMTDKFAATIRDLGDMVNKYGGPAQAAGQKLQVAQTNPIDAAKNQLALLRQLREDPTQNIALIDSQIKQTEAAIASLTKKAQLKSVGAASPDLGKVRDEAGRRRNEGDMFSRMKAPDTGVRAQNGPAASVTSDKKAEPVVVEEERKDKPRMR